MRTVPEYTTYPRKFITYKWYRPLITGVLFFVFYVVLGFALIFAATAFTGSDMKSVMSVSSGGYDNLDTYTSIGALISMGGVAVMLPALALANKVAGRRTFRSYASSRGGWNYGIFFRCLLIALIVIALPIAVSQIFVSGRTGETRFTLAGFILLTILGPMQCIAEEYCFRAFLMQTFGSWFRVPVIAIILSSAAFAAVHPYNLIGVASIFISGCCFCLSAWLSNGLEAGSALHIANNMTAFYTLGFGYGSLSSETTWTSLVFSAVIYILYVIVIAVCRKRGMFDKMKKDDAAEYNAKIEAKRAKKAAKKAAKQA